MDKITEARAIIKVAEAREALVAAIREAKANGVHDNTLHLVVGLDFSNYKKLAG